MQTIVKVIDKLRIIAIFIWYYSQIVRYSSQYSTFYASKAQKMEQIA